MTGIFAHIMITVQDFLGGLSGHWSELTGLATQHLGPSGPWILWGLVAFVGLFLLSKATKLAFDLLRLVVLPSAAMSIALAMLVPCWVPMKTFPAFLAVTMAMMFIRSR